MIALAIADLSACIAQSNNEALTAQYLEKIRSNTAQLSAFFSQMPKGGDLHNHFSGSVYAETYIDYVVARDYYIDTVTLTVDSLIPQFIIQEKREKDCMKLSALDKLPRKQLATFKQRLIQKWSVKDYNGVSYPSDKQFFETFSAFAIANNNNSRLEAGLLELKARALKENVSYIETMFTSIPCSNGISRDATDKYNTALARAQSTHDEALTQSILAELYKMLQDSNVASCAAAFNNDFLTETHNRLKIDDSSFKMRYQNYVVRVVPAVSVFKNLVICFESANTSPLVVGVNIVAPEDNETSMRDYWLHMQMYKFCHAKYPKVKYAMHAGELAMGLVKPEELTWHINEAVYTAGANRIGHGVDVYYEDSCYRLLQHMTKSNTAVEINLYSNEFILKVKESAHPLDLYRKFKVPIVICTDDAGVLRSNMVHQYVLLASRYKDVSYSEMKRFVYNSIDYSFIEEEPIKKQLKADLAKRFDKFEREIAATVR